MRELNTTWQRPIRGCARVASLVNAQLRKLDSHTRNCGVAQLISTGVLGTAADRRVAQSGDGLIARRTTWHPAVAPRPRTRLSRVYDTHVDARSSAATTRLLLRNSIARCRDFPTYERPARACRRRRSIGGLSPLATTGRHYFITGGSRAPRVIANSTGNQIVS
jgi:hypothetical protein